MPGKIRETTVEERQLIIKLHNEEKSLREIGRILSKPFSTIRYIIRKIKNTEQLNNSLRSGRPRKLTTRDENFIIREIKKNPFKSAPKLAATLYNVTEKHVHPDTIKNVLRKHGYRARTARRKPFVSIINRRKRLEFAKKYINQSAEFWKSVVFSDESKFMVTGSDGKKWVFRKQGEALKTCNLQATVKGGGGSVMVWGCFAANGVGNLSFIQGIMDRYGYLDILKQNLKKSAEKLNLVGRFHFQHDNDPKHTSKIVKEWLLYNVPHMLQTPPQSPDLNPIENLWDILDQQVRLREIKNKEQLVTALTEEWAKIKPNITENLINSMPRRLQAVIDANGYPTKY